MGQVWGRLMPNAICVGFMLIYNRAHGLTGPVVCRLRPVPRDGLGHALLLGSDLAVDPDCDAQTARPTLLDSHHGRGQRGIERIMPGEVDFGNPRSGPFTSGPRAAGRWRWHDRTPHGLQVVRTRK